MLLFSFVGFYQYKSNLYAFQPITLIDIYTVFFDKTKSELTTKEHKRKQK